MSWEEKIGGREERKGDKRELWGKGSGRKMRKDQKQEKTEKSEKPKPRTKQEGKGGVPVMEQQKRIRLGTLRLQV